MMNPSNERRNQRSEIKAEALQLQLQASARQAEAEAMLLADSDGLLVAMGPGPLPEAEEVAAYSPQLASIRGWVGTMRCTRGLRNVVISPFRLGAERAYLCAVGLKSSRPLPSFQRTRDGVRRILAS
jgi:hypothetical protein